MKLSSVTLLVAASLSLTAFCFGLTPARAADTTGNAASDVVATVNGQDITKQDLDFASDEVGAQLANVPPSDRDRMLLQFVMQTDLMAQAAQKDKLEDAPSFKARLAYHRERALRDAYFAAKIKGSISEAAAKKIYEERIATLKPQKEIRARHILVATKAEAEEIEKELKNGADFAKLAKEKSKDSGSDGGDLGWFTRGQMVKPFEDAAFALKKGQISDPVHTQFGWHIIEVTGVKTQPLPSFDQVKSAIMGKLLEQKVQETLGKLQSSAKIDIKDPAIKKSMEDAAMRGEVPPGAAGSDNTETDDASGH